MHLLLLLTNLLLWEHVSSKSNLLLSTEDLYHVVEQAHTNYGMSADIYHEFTEDVLKAVIIILRAWDYPLIHLVLATTILPTASASNNMLQRINDVKNGIIGLLEGLEIILSRTQPGVIVDYPHCSGQREFQSSDEDTRLFAMYNLCRCLKRDTQKVESYLKIVKDRVIFKDNY
ncbi:prolactin-3D4-like [Peromyscus californicus insignis]|uniref:prolactin-3D4-like n=1 Tax=Peromyscus californicus insignis TaxID=564181 RepID=UPI0022A773C5|nr:prolactin-3D4-like [Peromyscus californicus insignis]